MAERVFNFDFFFRYLAPRFHSRNIFFQAYVGHQFMLVMSYLVFEHGTYHRVETEDVITDYQHSRLMSSVKQVMIAIIYEMFVFPLLTYNFVPETTIITLHLVDFLEIDIFILSSYICI